MINEDILRQLNEVDEKDEDEIEETEISDEDTSIEDEVVDTEEIESEEDLPTIANWQVVKSKTVEDEDGEETDFVWYYRYKNGESEHIFVLGDAETTEPSIENAEFETDSIVEAREYFENYDSSEEEIEDEEEIEVEETPKKESLHEDMRNKKYIYKAITIIDSDVDISDSDFKDAFDETEESMIDNAFDQALDNIEENKDRIEEEVNAKLIDFDIDNMEAKENECLFYFTFDRRVNEDELYKALSEILFVELHYDDVDDFDTRAEYDYSYSSYVGKEVSISINIILELNEVMLEEEIEENFQLSENLFEDVRNIYDEDERFVKLLHKAQDLPIHIKHEYFKDAKRTAQEIIDLINEIQGE